MRIINSNIIYLLLFFPYIFSINYNWTDIYTYQYPIPLYPGSGFICCQPNTQVLHILQDPITSKINASITFKENVGCTPIKKSQPISYTNIDVSNGSFSDDTQAKNLTWNYNPNNFTIGILDTLNYCIYIFSSQNAFITNMSDYKLDGTWIFFGALPDADYTANLATNLDTPYCLPNSSQNIIIVYDNNTNLTTMTITFPNTTACNKLQLTDQQNFTATFLAGSFVYTDSEYYGIIRAYYLPYNQTLVIQFREGIDIYYYNSNSTNLATTLCNCKPLDTSSMGSRHIHSIANAIITVIFIIFMIK